MNFTRIVFLNALVLCFTTVSNAQQKENSLLKLWYRTPSGTVWENALPIGNGRLGAMVYGNPEMEVLQLNEATVWSGGPNRNDNPDALAALPTVRELIFKGQYKAAQNLAGEKIQTKKSNGQIYQPVGNLKLKFEGHENPTEFYRDLNLENAISTTTYKVDGVTYTREAFVSRPDEVIVVRLTASKPGKISFTAFMDAPQLQSEKKPVATQKVNVATDDAKRLVLSGITSDHEGVKGQVKFRAITKIEHKKGVVAMSDSGVKVTAADEVIIYISIATNFKNYNDITGDEVQRAENYLTKALKKSYAQIREQHVKTYSIFFKRVKLDVGVTDSIKNPTDVRLRDFSKGNDPQFAGLYFQFGRYLLISGSSQNGQPANLQGVWNNLVSPPWDSKYTLNINAEMNYWPAENTNLSELHEPFIQMVKDLSVTGRQTAKDMYGAGGWMAHHNTDIWRITGPTDKIHYAMWPMGGAWTSQHLWEKYLYSGDKEYLKSVYPVLKEASQFYLDFLIKEPSHGWLVVSPSMSPEDSPKGHEGASISAGTTMDNQIVFDLLSNTIRAAEVLGLDKEFVAKVKETKSKLPPMQIGQHSQLQEWQGDWDDPESKHRHISHLFGLFPGRQISAYRTPQLFEAARNSVLYRGDVSTGWSMGWKVNVWARFLDGNHAYKLITDQLKPLGENESGGGTYNNLFDAHAPFQIDGNFGCTAGITEMLMQSHDGCINLLPALPDAWPSGKIEGIKTRGGFEIAMEWKNKKIVKLQIKAVAGGLCRLRLPNNLTGSVQLLAAKGENSNALFSTETVMQPILSNKANLKGVVLPKTVLVEFNAQKGKTYIFTAGK